MTKQSLASGWNKYSKFEKMTKLVLDQIRWHQYQEVKSCISASKHKMTFSGQLRQAKTGNLRTTLIWKSSHTWMMLLQHPVWMKNGYYTLKKQFAFLWCYHAQASYPVLLLLIRNKPGLFLKSLAVTIIGIDYICLMPFVIKIPTMELNKYCPLQNWCP